MIAYFLNFCVIKLVFFPPEAQSDVTNAHKEALPEAHTHTRFLQPHSAAPAAVSFMKPEAVKPGLEMLKQMLGSSEPPDRPHCG